MDYLELMNNLLKETFAFANYKKLPVLFRILCTIVVFPFIFSFFILVGLYYLLATLYKCLKSPVEHLLNFVKEEGKDVKHATQFIIYLIGFPIIFLVNVFLSVLVCGLFILNLLINITGYIATLGGITFTPFLFDKKERKFEENKFMGSIAVIVFSVIGLILVSLYYIYILGIFGIIYFDYYSDLLPFYYGSIAYSLFVIIYIFVTSRKK